MNKINLTGRFTKEVFLDESKSGVKFCKFTVAARRMKDQTDFFNCIAFNKRAETIVKYCTKGSMVSVSGVMQSNRDNDKKITYWEVLVDDIEFLNSKTADDEVPNAVNEMRKVDDDETELYLI